MDRAWQIYGIALRETTFATEKFQKRRKTKRKYFRGKNNSQDSPISQKKYRP